MWRISYIEALFQIQMHIWVSGIAEGPQASGKWEEEHCYIMKQQQQQQQQYLKGTHAINETHQDL